METKDRVTRPSRPSGGRPTGQKRKRPARPSVVYTDPKPFSGKRLALHLVTVLAVSLAVLFGVSIFFKVDMDKVTVSGTDKYSVNEIIDASGIQSGNNLLALSNARVSGRIIAKLPYVNEVRVGIKLPDTVHIEIKELEVAYAVEDGSGDWWLINASGKVVDSIDAAAAKTYTCVQGFQVDSPVIGEMAVALEATTGDEPSDGDTTAPEDSKPAEETKPEESSAPNQKPEDNDPPAVPSATGAERMEIALEILQQMENCGIVGQAASVDVSDTAKLELWYGNRYQVNLGDRQRLDYKISLMKGAIDQMGEHQGGNLDVSFVNWPDQVAYTPFPG